MYLGSEVVLIKLRFSKSRRNDLRRRRRQETRSHVAGRCGRCIPESGVVDELEIISNLLFRKRWPQIRRRIHPEILRRRVIIRRLVSQQRLRRLRLCVEQRVQQRRSVAIRRRIEREGRRRQALASRCSGIRYDNFLIDLSERVGG